MPTMELITKLRGMTGAGIADCKTALVESKDDIDLAIKWLREKGISSAVKRAERKANQGLVHSYIHAGGKLGVLVEVNCETDFVAHNEGFRAFCDDVARKLTTAPNLEALEADRVAAVAKIGENVKLNRFIRFEVTGNGLVAAYIHTGAKVGVLVEVGAGKEATVTNEDFKQLVRDITLQIAAGSPIAVSREFMPEDVVAKEKEIAMEQVKKHGHDSGTTEDQAKQTEKELQKLTDEYIAKIDVHVAHKEKEIMTV